MATSIISPEQAFEQFQDNLVIQSSDFSLSGLKDMVQREVIDVSPKYQRRSRWDVERQSQLIESFMLNVPVPPIYLAEEDYGRYSVIDGKQRITAVYEFLTGGFALKKLSRFTEVNGQRFKDLPVRIQNALSVRPYLRVVTLLRQSDEELKYEVFIRLNKAGIQLNAQEIRNVAFRGPLNTAIYDIAGNAFLRNCLKITNDKSSAYQTMMDAEFVLRFLTLSRSDEFFGGSFSRAMDQYMIANRNMRKNEIENISHHFNYSLETCEKIWGEYAFQRWDGTRWRKFALAGMYDAEMLATTQLTKKQLNNATANRGRVLRLTKKLFEDADFDEAVRSGTNTPARLKYRVEEIRAMLESV